MLKYLPALLLVFNYTNSIAQHKINADSVYHLALHKSGVEKFEALNLASEAYVSESNFKKAFETAQQVVDQTTNGVEQGKAFVVQGKCNYFFGKHELALQLYLKALSLFEKNNYLSGQAYAHNEIGTFVKRQGDVNKSIEHFEKAIALARQASDSLQMASGMNNLGIAYEAKGRLEDALKLYEESAVIKQSMNDLNGLSYNLDNMGMVLTLLKRYDEGEQKFKEGLALRLKLGDRSGYGMILNNMGELYLAQNNYSKAIPYFQQALSIAKETHYADFESYVNKMLSDLFRKEKEYQKSFAYLDRHLALKDSIFNEQKSKQIQELEVQYETEKKEQQINIQQLVIRQQGLKLERNQAITIGLIILIILIILIVILWQRSVKLIQQKNFAQQQREHQEQLTRTVVDLQEKERARFAQDLHDGFGQMITALKFQIEKPFENMQSSAMLLLHQMNDEIRNVSFALWPQVLQRDGLVQAVRELASRINTSNKVSITVNAIGLADRLIGNTEINLYRICQEWLNNILKYSNADKITLQLINHDDELVLTIEDNGAGFNTHQLQTGKGNGWQNIQSRAQILESMVEVDSREGRNGTTFILNLPKKQIALRNVA